MAKRTTNKSRTSSRPKSKPAVKEDVTDAVEVPENQEDTAPDATAKSAAEKVDTPEADTESETPEPQKESVAVDTAEASKKADESADPKVEADAETSADDAAGPPAEADAPVEKAASDEATSPDEAAADEASTDQGATDDAPTEDAAAQAQDEDTLNPDERDSQAEAHPDGTLPEEDATPEDKPAEAPVAAAPPPEPAKASVWPMIIAGAVVAILGYAAGRNDVLGQFLPVDWRAPDQTAELRIALEEGLSGLRTELAPQIESAAGAVEAVSAQVEELAAKVDAPAPEVDLSPVEGAIADVSARLEAIENRPLVTTDAEATDYTDAFNALMEQSKAQQAEITALLEAAAQAEADAALAAKTTIARASLSEMQAALDAGKPFAEPLQALVDTGLLEVPEALTSVAADGVATLTDLQQTISDTARAALETARAQEGVASGLGGFLERQLGVRSLEPQEGDDPDAVLSRVEAAANSGDLTLALSEADALPEAAKTAMSEWISRASARTAALEAVTTLSDSLPMN